MEWDFIFPLKMKSPLMKLSLAKITGKPLCRLSFNRARRLGMMDRPSCVIGSRDPSLKVSFTMSTTMMAGFTEMPPVLRRT
jgi:hypothetical protein